MQSSIQNKTPHFHWKPHLLEVTARKQKLFWTGAIVTNQGPCIGCRWHPRVLGCAERSPSACRNSVMPLCRRQMISEFSSEPHEGNFIPRNKQMMRPLCTFVLSSPFVFYWKRCSPLPSAEHHFSVMGRFLPWPHALLLCCLCIYYLHIGLQLQLSCWKGTIWPSARRKISAAGELPAQWDGKARKVPTAFFPHAGWELELGSHGLKENTGNQLDILYFLGSSSRWAL